MTLINRDFLKEMAPDAVMKKIALPMFVRGVGPGNHLLVDYATIDLYFPGNKCCIAAVHQEVHVINGLKAKMLIGINILGRKSFTINTGNRRATIESCDNIVILLEGAPRAQMQFTQQILAHKDTVILLKTLRQIPVQSKLPEGKDLLFEPSCTKPNVSQ